MSRSRTYSCQKWIGNIQPSKVFLKYDIQSEECYPILFKIYFHESNQNLLIVLHYFRVYTFILWLSVEKICRNSLLLTVESLPIGPQGSPTLLYAPIYIFWHFILPWAPLQVFYILTASLVRTHPPSVLTWVFN